MNSRNLTSILAGIMLTGSAIAGEAKAPRSDTITAKVWNADGSNLTEQTFSGHNMTYPSVLGEKLKGYPSLINGIYTKGTINVGDAVDFVRYDENGKEKRRIRATFVGFGEPGKGHYEIYGNTRDLPKSQPLFFFLGNEYPHMLTAEGFDKMGLNADQVVKSAF